MIEEQPYVPDLCSAIGCTVCCTSCHEDDELGYFDLQTYTLIDGRRGVLCCFAHELAEEMGLLRIDA